MPLVISIAGSDPGRGAGLQMDERVCRRLGVQFRGVVAVDTLQDDEGLHSVTPRPVEKIVAELREALATLPSRDVAIKTGALGTANIVNAIANEVHSYSQQIGAALPLVIDPVRAATKNLGAQLLDLEGWLTMKSNLFPLATVVTPNTLEFGDGSDFKNCSSVFLKGGHRRVEDEDNAGSVIDELWMEGVKVCEIRKPKVPNATSLHGTGCALSTAIAANLAQSEPLIKAVEHASWFMQDWLAILAPEAD